MWKLYPSPAEVGEIFVTNTNCAILKGVNFVIVTNTDDLINESFVIGIFNFIIAGVTFITCIYCTFLTCEIF
jgi:hypothetical protein